MDLGVPSFARFADFTAEGKKLLDQLQDPNFNFDQKPELLGIVQWFLSIGSKYFLDIKKNFLFFLEKSQTGPEVIST